MIEVGSLKECGIDKERVTVIKAYDGSVQGCYVLYWMQASIRSDSNAALEYAAAAANNLGLPLVVCFVLTPSYPNAGFRHYHFLDEGLSDVSRGLEARGIKFIIRLGSPPDVILKLSDNAAFLACDCGYTRLQRQWRRKVYDNVQCPSVEVEDNVVVPVELVSDKEEYAARTIRPKITRHLGDFLKPVKQVEYNKSLSGSGITALDVEILDQVVKSFDNDGVPVSKIYTGGPSAAKRRLKDFVANKLADYGRRNDPNADVTSHLSPYLHFGMISPLEVALEAVGRKGSEDFLEQLIIRRELAINFVYYNDGYDDYEKAVPDWAKKTLRDAQGDPREYTYSRRQLENAQTHDPAWNAAQRQLAVEGYMAGYMRMYWGKKVIEWSDSPQEAFDILNGINDKYELDGRDPNGYAGVAWCFGKHDRPWTPRAIFGTVRYMNYAGLKRKFDVEKYCADNS
jgi:deoxyribodipyrimidine photo-lyase